MKFNTATSLARTMTIISALLCVAGLLFKEELAPIRAFLTILALLILVAAIIIIVVFCKCPYCGKRIFMGASTVAYCPNCRRNLETGKKGSKKKAATARRPK